MTETSVDHHFAMSSSRNLSALDSNVIMSLYYDIKKIKAF